YAPSITRGVISVSRLYEDGFVNRFVDNTIQDSRNNVVYFSAVQRDGIFEIDLSNSLTNESSVYAVSNKRAKLDLDSALLWHCRLGHISKKRIEKLQHEGLLNSSDLRAFEKCVSCMSGKMAKKPYTHQVERAKDLIGLIHTDNLKVYGCTEDEIKYIGHFGTNEKIRSGPARLLLVLRLVVGRIVGRNVVGKQWLGLVVVVVKTGYIAFVVAFFLAK
nr:retrotransposon protein, putative, Ty1-copia subclass [Tanacetum cinerariifolium]